MKDENDRKLTPAEQKRLANFEAIRAGLESEGYRTTELTVSIARANVFAIALLIPFGVVGLVLFYLYNGGFRYNGLTIYGSVVVFLLALFALVVIHELIHGITWGIFAEGHLKSIEFGFMKELLTPYCTCKVALPKGAYVTGTLMPLIILGFGIMAAAIFAGSFGWLMMGIIMCVSAGGDILVVLKLLGYKSDAKDMLIFDHPTKAGSVIFER